MPLIKRGIRAAKPLAMAMGLSALAADKDVELVVVDAGDAGLARDAADLLGASVGTPRDEDMLVAVIAPGGNAAHIAPLVGGHRRRGGDAVVAVLGTPVQRRRAERALLADPDVEMSVVLHADSLDASGRDALRAAVVRGLATRAVAAGRRHPPLRPEVGRRLERRAARRAAVVASVPGVTGAAMPLLTVIQARLAADLSGLAGARPDARSAGQVAGIAVAAPLWRASARRLITAVPSAETIVRGGLAYTVTRGVAAGARRLTPSGPDPVQEER